MPKEITFEKDMKRGFVWSLSSLFNSGIYLIATKEKTINLEIFLIC